jgi:hypothetical protein
MVVVDEGAAEEKLSRLVLPHLTLDAGVSVS